MVEPEPIVVGVDESAAGVRALRSALEEARLRHLPVLVVAACRPGAEVSSSLEPYERCMRSLNTSLRACLAGEPDPPVRAELVGGRAADVLVERSEHAAMLVLGEHEREPGADEHLGGTVRECLRRVRCPVLVVPAARGREPVPGPVANDPVLG